MNVSYDPTRELFQEINAAFQTDYEARHGQSVTVTQSHGGSGSQARAVIDGLRADVVSLALAGDIDAISRRGLLSSEWANRLEHRSCPYHSVIVLLVRKGNPKRINDWNDLTRSDVSVITPNPKTSGGARWNFLAAWCYATMQQGNDESEAKEFMAKLYRNVPKMDSGARGAMETFLRKRQGDVLIAWENEAILGKTQFDVDGVEIVYPSITMKAEPPVAWVDSVTDARGTTELAQTYLRYLYSDAAQHIIARHGYRPSNPAIGVNFPTIRQISIQELTGDWATAQQRFFRDGGIFDQVFHFKER